MISFSKRLLIVLICVVILILVYLTYLNHQDYIEIFDLSYEFKNNRPNISSQKLLDIPFRYLINNEFLCTDENSEILAVFIVTSYFGNVETRSSMRQAFPLEDLKKHKLRRIFLLGTAPTDIYINQDVIEKENEKFRDIIQGNFIEAYRNLTYKHVMGLKWITTFCSNSKYIIKMDDDIVVNMYMIESILMSLNNIRHQKFIAGYVLTNMVPIREPTNKWYVTKEEYPFSRYPPFVSGWFYITNVRTVKNLVALVNYEPYFWIDDLYITGILAAKLKITLYNISKHFTPNSEFLQCCLQDFNKDLYCDINIGPNGGDNNMFYHFNKQAKKCFHGKCKRRLKSIDESCVAEQKMNLGKGLGFVNSLKLK